MTGGRRNVAGRHCGGTQRTRYSDRKRSGHLAGAAWCVAPSPSAPTAGPAPPGKPWVCLLRDVAGTEIDSAALSRSDSPKQNQALNPGWQEWRDLINPCESMRWVKKGILLAPPS